MLLQKISMISLITGEKHIGRIISMDYDRERITVKWDTGACGWYPVSYPYIEKIEEVE